MFRETTSKKIYCRQGSSSLRKTSCSARGMCLQATKDACPCWHGCFIQSCTHVWMIQEHFRF
ncbi:hypothetical protein BKA67DRAFT_570669, partial [Truncatella angustata]